MAEQKSPIREGRGRAPSHGHKLTKRRWRRSQRPAQKAPLSCSTDIEPKSSNDRGAWATANLRFAWVNSSTDPSAEREARGGLFSLPRLQPKPLQPWPDRQKPARRTHEHAPDAPRPSARALAPATKRCARSRANPPTDGNGCPNSPRAGAGSCRRPPFDMRPAASRLTGQVLQDNAQLLFI